jgi:hypothetical protein
MTGSVLHLVLACAALCGGLGCGGTSKVSAAGVSRPEVGVVPPDMKQDYEVFAVNCSKCHDLDRALSMHVTHTRQWDTYVAKMMRTAGSAIQAKESPHILRFLYWYTAQKQRLSTERADDRARAMQGDELPAAQAVPVQANTPPAAGVQAAP